GESDYVKVLVDGVPVNDPGGAYNFAHLTTDNVERVEVLRGPASVLYGSDAVTGVVQIFTRRGAGPTAVHASALGGSFGT
ncbi:TonB-dependent receptor, partial [Escherichia coli]